MCLRMRVWINQYWIMNKWYIIARAEGSECVCRSKYKIIYLKTLEITSSCYGLNFIEFKSILRSYILICTYIYRQTDLYFNTTYGEREGLRISICVLSGPKNKCKTTLNWTNIHFSFGFFITESSDEKKIIAINFELYSGWII